MVRNLRSTLLATVAVAFTTAGAQAGSLGAYGGSAAVGPAVTTYSAPVQQIEPYVEPVYAPAPVMAEPVEAYHGADHNADFGYQQSHACGGAVDGEHCLVILNDHMRRVRLDRPAGTILVGNPTIADVTVLGNDTMFVSARSIGSTNIIALDKAGNEIVTYEVFVREPRTKRVVLRNAGVAENYQCAPHCERALTQSDSAEPYGAKLGIVSGDIGLDQQAIGLQSGANPNVDPAAAAGPAAAHQQHQAPGAGATGPQSGLIGSVNELGGSVAPAVNMIGSMMNGVGGYNNAPVPPMQGAAPPLPN